MIKYQKNNIVFRIASSTAISKFKEIQAHTFIQLNRKDLQFDDDAKEVVLLMYDRFSQWIYRTERICLTASAGDKLSNDLIPVLCDSFVDELTVAQSVIESYSDLFPQKLVKLVKLVNSYSSSIVRAKLLQLTNMKMDEFYPSIIHEVNVYLQHILVCMHEYNHNLIVNRAAPFISKDDFCSCGMLADTMVKVDPCEQRLQYFIEENGSRHFLLKNYSSENKDYSFDLAQAWAAKYNVTLLKEAFKEV